MSPKIALVHEWIAGRTGSERVFEAIAQIFPEADLWALSSVDDHGLDLNGRNVRTTVLDRPGLRDRRGLTLPLMPAVWRSLNHESYDLVISSHHAFAAHNAMGVDSLHLSYVHTPARYVWSPELDSRGGNPLFAPARGVLQMSDLAGIRHIDALAANSHETARRIAFYWNRPSRVIHPPVDTHVFAPGASIPDIADREYILGFSRFIPYKRLDLVIEAGELTNTPVILAGRGPELPRLRELAKSALVPVRVIEGPSDEELVELYRHARCVVFPAFEDFGIVPLEAQGCGTPVIALGAGGSLDTVRPGFSGFHVAAQDARLLAMAIQRIEEIDPMDCRRHAETFGVEHFNSNIVDWVETYYPGVVTAHGSGN